MEKKLFNLGHLDLICKSCSVVLSAFSAAPPDIQFHLQRLDVLEFVGVPLFDLLIFPRREEQMSLGDELEEHDAAERRRQGDGTEVTSVPGKNKIQNSGRSIKGKRWRESRRDERAAGVKSRGSWRSQSPRPSARRRLFPLGEEKHALARRFGGFGSARSGGTCRRGRTWSGGSRQSPNPRSSRFCQRSRWQ